MPVSRHYLIWLAECDNYNNLPIELKYSSERQLEKKKLLIDVLLKLKLHKYTTVFNSFDSFDDFKSMAEVVPHSETLKGMLGMLTRFYKPSDSCYHF